ncbi:hypothetical protein ACJJTC_013701 [Scirpophaga incertulas]
MVYRVLLLLVAIGCIECKLWNLSCQQIKILVDGHNSRRQQLVTGKIAGQPASSDMKFMVWDEELAAKAAKWASQNRHGHNPDKKVASGRFNTGENLYWYSTTDRSYSLNLDSALEVWFKEHKDYSYGPMKYSDFRGSKKIGHYTQMAWADTTHVGCAVSQWWSNGWNQYFVVCNYGPASSLAVLVCFTPWISAQVLLKEPPLRVDLRPPEGSEALARNVFSGFVFMPIDHFDPQNNETYVMRYMYNQDFFGDFGNPVYILIGGEWDINAGWLRTGNMYEMAVENKGYMFYTEHRYYGASLPFQEFTTENLRFLSADQALADLAYFIRNHIRSQFRFRESKIILYGGSYAANLALWFKQRYPHLVDGVVASSGPILAKVDYYEYLEIVHEAFLLEGGQSCINIIKQGIEDTTKALETDEGRLLVESTYPICGRLNHSNPYDMAYFSGAITWAFSGEVQSARPGSIRDVCNNFRNNVYGSTPMEQISGYIADVPPGRCWELTFKNFLNNYNRNNNARAWMYQVCTEFGYFQTVPSSGTVFDSLKWMNTDFYAETCKQAFDPRFDEIFVRNAVDHSNRVNGGLSPNVQNTINVHGYIDPWRGAGVHQTDLADSSPTFIADRASHCFDMRSWSRYDTIRMTNIQQAIRRITAEWVSQ